MTDPTEAEQAAQEATEITVEDLAAWAARIEAKRKANNERFEMMERQGTPVNPLSILQSRIKMLCTWVLGPDADSGEPSPQRLAFEQQLQDGYAQGLDELEAEVRKAQLLRPMAQQNGNGAQRLIVPGM